MFGFGKKSKVKKTKTDYGMHGDHWDVIFGYDDPNKVQAKIKGYLKDLKGMGSNGVAERVKYAQGSYSAIGALKRNDLITLFPCYQVPRVLPVEIVEIVEWKHAHDLEAQIIGGGRDTFALNFFATDYMWRREDYEKGGQQNVALVGFCFGLEDFDVSEFSNGEQKFSQDFCSYMPHSELPGGMYFSGIGDIVSVSEVQIDDENMKLIELKLIHDPDDPEFFILPLLVNEAHVSGSLEIGTKKGGAFWLQGRLA